jgi:hypothetical protein
LELTILGTSNPEKKGKKKRKNGEKRRKVGREGSVK